MEWRWNGYVGSRGKEGKEKKVKSLLIVEIGLGIILYYLERV